MATTEAFLSLSDKIKEWISSEEVVGIISEIDVDFGIEGEGESILPGLILRLVAQEIDPRHFVNEIGAALKINYETAKKIAQRVDSGILKPIEVELGKAGTDTHQIFDYAEPPLKDLERYVEKPEVDVELSSGVDKVMDSHFRGNDPVKSQSDHGASKVAEPAPKIIQNSESILKQEILKEIPDQVQNDKVAEPAPLIKKVPAQAPDNLPMRPVKEKVDRPFILHEETPINAPQSKSKTEKNLPTFSYQPTGEEQDEVKKPVKVEIEIGNGQVMVKPATNDMLRVVHYSNFYTGLTQPNLKNNKKDGEVPVPRGRWFL